MYRCDPAEYCTVEPGYPLNDPMFDKPTPMGCVPQIEINWISPAGSSRNAGDLLVSAQTPDSG